jgi:hypothetical protein
VSFDRGGIYNGVGESGSVVELRRFCLQWRIFGERAEMRRSEGENGGGRRSFIERLRIDAPLDTIVMD